MQLTPEILQRLAHNEGVHHGKYAAERRKHQRLWMGRKAVIRRIGAPHAEPIAVVVRDLSAAGVGLVHSQVMPVGSTFSLTMSGGAQDTQPYVTVECQTVRCDRASGGGAYVVGAQFVRILSPAPREPAVV